VAIFLDIHLIAAVAVDIDNQCVGMGRLNAHRGWQAEAHRSQATGGQKRPRLPEFVKLGRPHLVLADADGDIRLALGGEARKLGDRVLL